MTQVISVRKLQPFELPAYARRDAASKTPQVDRRDLILVVGFCAVGLILTFAALAMPTFFIPAVGIDLVP